MGGEVVMAGGASEFSRDPLQPMNQLGDRPLLPAGAGFFAPFFATLLVAVMPLFIPRLEGEANDVRELGAVALKDLLDRQVSRFDLLRGPNEIVGVRPSPRAARVPRCTISGNDVS